MNKRENSPVRLEAMNLLAQREHSRRELWDKLRKHFPDCADGEVDAVVSELGREGLQSDARFVESFIHGRVRKGQGPARIHLELQQRGVADELIVEGLSGFDWYHLARQVRQKKFGDEPVRDYRQRAKIGRFLQYRGFGSDEINACLAQSDG